MRSQRKEPIIVSRSPARFLSAHADVEDHEYINGAQYRSVMGRIYRRVRNGEIIAPHHAGRQTLGDAPEWTSDDGVNP